MSIPLQLLANIIQAFSDGNGDPLAGGKIYSYAAGTTTPQATYTDSTGNTPNTNPIALNSAGQASIWLNSNGYKFVIEDSLGNVLSTTDDVFSSAPPGSIVAAQIADNTITGTQIANGAIGSTQIAPGGVETSNIATGAITGPLIATGTIEESNLDPAIDLSTLDNMIEVVVEQSDGEFITIPQFPWTAPSFTNNPDILPAGDGTNCAWSKDGKLLAVTHFTSPFVSIYQRYAASFHKLADPAALPAGTGEAVAFSPDGKFLAVGCATTPYIAIYQRFGATWIQLPAPTTLPANTVFSLSWTPDSKYLACAVASSPYMIVYKQTNVTTSTYWDFVISAGTASSGASYTNNGSTFVVQADVSTGARMIATSTGAGSPVAGTNLVNVGGTGDATIGLTSFKQIVAETASFVSITNPSPLPSGLATGASWSPDGQFLAITSQASPYINVYQNIAGTLTALSNPSTLPPGNGTSCAWSPDGTLLAVGSQTSSYLVIYELAGTTLTALTGISAASQVNGVSWSMNGLYLALALNSTPYFALYKRSGTTFTLQTAPSVLPGANPRSIAFSATGQFIAMTTFTSPFVQIYQTGTPFFPTDGVLWVRNLTNV